MDRVPEHFELRYGDVSKDEGRHGTLTGNEDLDNVVAGKTGLFFSQNLTEASGEVGVTSWLHSWRKVRNRIQISSPMWRSRTSD